MRNNSVDRLTIIREWWCGLVGVIEDGGFCMVQTHAKAFSHAQDTHTILQVKCITGTQTRTEMP